MGQTVEDKVMVPELRFSEFKENWSYKKLGNLCGIKSASRVHKDEWTEHGVPFFRSSDVVAKYKGLENSKAFISERLFIELSDKSGRIKKGDLLVTGGGSIGIPYLVPDDEPLYFKDADLLWFKNSENLDSLFLYIYLTTTIFRRYIASVTHIGTIAHYTIEQGKATPITFPSLLEQQKIASFLSAVDKKLNQLRRKRDALQSYKRGVMQKIFSQEIRFSQDDGTAFSDWEENRLRDVADVNPRVGELPDRFNYIDLESVNDGVLSFAGEISKLEAPSRAQRTLLKKDILFQTVRPYQKNNMFFELDGVYVASTGYAQIRTQLVPEFLYQKLHTDSFLKEVMKRCTGTSYPAISSSDLAEICIKFPSDRNEQQKIANFLSAIDQKIDHVKQQITQTDTFKKGLLQKMFV